MAKKSMSRQIRDFEERKMRGALTRLDALAAAYVKECDIRPSEARLVIEELSKEEQKTSGKVMKYHFEHFAPTIDTQVAHPDVSALLAYALLLVKARTDNNIDDINTTIDQMGELLRKYDDKPSN